MNCTYCGGSEFYEGPSGGASINVLCANKDCRHWFNDTPFGFDDLHRVEPTDEEKHQKKLDAEIRIKTRRDSLLMEGELAFSEGKDPDELRTGYAYGSYAEAEDNVTRLTGFMRAMAKELRSSCPPLITSKQSRRPSKT